jgi:hypothetical protein
MLLLYPILPFVAVILFLAVTIAVGIRRAGNWTIPAAITALFLGWSIYTVAAEGPVGFWPNHTVNAWGNQVWFDLLIAIAIAWTVLLPRARAAGMQTWPWLGFILATGCIGLGTMYARCLYLEARRQV